MINFIPQTQEKFAKNAVFLLDKYSKKDNSAPSCSVIFEKDSHFSGDDYQIISHENRIIIRGNSNVSFNSAVGNLVRHQCGEIVSENIHFQNDFRAVYFANHFFNYYHSAPIEEVCEYLESLALWGQNALVLWFDMHHFSSISSPDAQNMLLRMQILFQKARNLGMKTCLTRLANEYYVGTPKHLLAQNNTDDGLYKNKLSGFYYTELCPFRKDGEELLLESCEQLLDAFAKIGLDYIILWPYDQGGCTCKSCYPWGSNAFFNLAKKQAKLAKKHFHDIKIILSCWRFDHFTNGEWDSFLPRVVCEGEWIDYLMVDIDANLPQSLADFKLPILSFPEISMTLTPWGGFGICPIPRHLQANVQRTKSFCCGGALYSEGIFEDIDKVVSLELMRNPDISPKDTIFEYCRYHFGTEHAETLTDIIMQSEDSAPRYTQTSDGEISDYPSRMPTKPHTYVLKNTELVQTLAEQLNEIHPLLSDKTKNSWRYKQIYCRIIGDACLVRHNGQPCAETDKIYETLVKIYHAKCASYWVSPITRESILQNRGGSID